MEENKSSVKNKTCPNCKKDFLCLSDDIGSCECNLIPLHSDDLLKISGNFNGCLCKSCLIQLSSIQINFK